MSKNFFAALDDSDDEAPSATPIGGAVKNKDSGAKPKGTANKAVVEPSKVDDKNSKPPGQHDRNTKFGRGSRAPARDGKRAYDRRSGTGRGKEIKKGGGGARNWGSDKDEARKGTQSQRVEGEGGELREEEESPVTEEPEIEEPEEPQVPTLTYEEYLEQQKSKQQSLSALAPVKERAVVNEFGSLAPKTAVEEDFLVMGGGKQKKVKAKQNNTRLEEKDISKEIKINVKRSDSGGDSRGEGRGGGRGRGRDGAGRGRGGRDGGRGGREGGRGRSSGGRGGRGGRINVNDASAFPSL